jgi:hypothetical protein
MSTHIQTTPSTTERAPEQGARHQKEGQDQLDDGHECGGGRRAIQGGAQVIAGQ